MQMDVYCCIVFVNNSEVIFQDRFLKYGVYCANLQEAIGYLAELMKNEAIRAQVEVSVFKCYERCQLLLFGNKW